MSHFHSPDNHIKTQQDSHQIEPFSIVKFPSSQQQQANKKHNFANAQFLVNGIGYASASEAACALLMERYIPNFKIIIGETYQVEIGRNQKGAILQADFQIDKQVIFEFHPPRLWDRSRRLGDFQSFAQKTEYYKKFQTCHGAERHAVKQAMIEKLALHYQAKRQAIMDRSEVHSLKQLIVAVDSADFYHKVIKIFGVDVPSEANVVAQFEALRNDIYRNNRIKGPNKYGPGAASLDIKKAA